MGGWVCPRRTYGTHRATYEPAQMRTFLRGRTETIRVVSHESVAFVHKFEERGADAAAKSRALAAACKQHVAFANMAATGHGIDRHLLGTCVGRPRRCVRAHSFVSRCSAVTPRARTCVDVCACVCGSGLRMLLLPGETAEFLFTDLDKRARTWSISTSNLSSEYYVSWGWGEVVPDGIGVAYSTQSSALRFNVTARKLMKINGFVENLERALKDMRDVCTASKPAKL